MKESNRLRKENNKLDAHLDGDYETVMTDMVCYLRSTDITDVYIEKVRRDLIDMFIEAKKRNEPVETVIGGDYKEFCDSITENVPRKSKMRKFCDVLSTLLLCAGIIGIIKILISKSTIYMFRDIFKGNDIDFNFTVNVGMIVSGILLTAFAIVFVRYICKTAFNDEKKKAKKRTIVMFFILFAVFAVIVASGVLLQDYELFNGNVFVGLAIMAVLITVGIIL